MIWPFVHSALDRYQPNSSLFVKTLSKSASEANAFLKVHLASAPHRSHTVPSHRPVSHTTHNIYSLYVRHKSGYISSYIQSPAEELQTSPPLSGPQSLLIVGTQPQRKVR